jgi:hypothetical protein
MRYAARALEFDDVSVRVVKVQGEAFALGPEVRRCLRMRDYPVLLQVTRQLLFNEGFDSQAKVVDVSSTNARTRATCASELPVDGNQVDHRGACAYVDQAQIVSGSNGLATQDRAVEGHTPVEVAHSEDQVVDSFDGERQHRWDRLEVGFVTPNVALGARLREYGGKRGQ